jgi:hypothetical protein
MAAYSTIKQTYKNVRPKAICVIYISKIISSLQTAQTVPEILLLRLLLH